MKNEDVSLAVLGDAQLPSGSTESSVIRPSAIENAGAVATIRPFTADQLFMGQSREFFNTVMDLAQAADAARRNV
jgi:hypothetical protein